MYFSFQWNICTSKIYMSYIGTFIEYNLTYFLVSKSIIASVVSFSLLLRPLHHYKDLLYSLVLFDKPEDLFID